jgi:hypothetical protein
MSFQLLQFFEAKSQMAIRQLLWGTEALRGLLHLFAAHGAQLMTEVGNWTAFTLF